MKKSVKCLIFILSLILTFSALGACDQDKNNPYNVGEVLLSFESEKEIQSMTVYRGINKVELNKEEKFISHGKRSLRICPETEISDGIYESSYIAFLGGGKYFTKTDFNDVLYLSVDIYNPSQQKFNMVWGVRGNDSDYCEICGGWNTVYKYIDREMLYAYNSGYVELLSFYFEGNEVSLDVYIDNIRYYITDSDFEKSTVSAKEIIEFEKSVEKNIFSVQKKSGDATAECVLSINNDLRYVKNGLSSLKVTAGTIGTSNPDKPILKVMGSDLPDFDKYRNVGWYFTMPVYNGGKNIVSCSIKFSAPLEDFDYTFEIAPLSWAKESEKISVDFIKDQFSGDGLDIQSITIRFERLAAGESVYIDRIGVRK